MSKVEEFLALDRETLDQKYEFINGAMVGMAGETKNHGILISNVNREISAHLRKSSCIVLAESTLKIDDECYLPDLMITCNEKDSSENKTYIEHPKLVIEVLSPGTETYDRRDKLLAYAHCEAIQEYVLINWDALLVQKMSRQANEGLDLIRWVETIYGEGDRVELETIGLTLAVEDIYEKVGSW